MHLKTLTLGVAALMATAASAQLTTNSGAQYLQGQTVDMSQQFYDFSNIYFFADSLTAFDTQTGCGTLKWKRQQLMPSRRA